MKCNDIRQGRGMPWMAVMLMGVSGCQNMPPRKAPMPGALIQDCREHCPEMVVLPTGQFVMGSGDQDVEADANERPAHEVSISQPIAIGKYEITRRQFHEFVTATQRDMVRCAGEKQPWSGRWDHDSTYERAGYPQTDMHPVVCVSWDDAVAYAQWLSGRTGQRYRLPTEAEWEYAARAGTQTRRFWGDAVTEQCRYGNGRASETPPEVIAKASKPLALCNDGHRFTAPVGQFAPNAFGIYDTLGNVMEWVQECAIADYRSSTDTTRVPPDCSKHMIRGGSWAADSVRLRSAFRFAQPNARVYLIGFRLVREL